MVSFPSSYSLLPLSRDPHVLSCPPLCCLWFGLSGSRSTYGNCACCYLRAFGVLWCGYSTEVTNAPTRELTARNCALHHRTDCESTVHLGSTVRVQYGIRLSEYERPRPSKSGTCTYLHIQGTWCERHRIYNTHLDRGSSTLLYFLSQTV